VTLVGGDRLGPAFARLDALETPAFVCDTGALDRNLAILGEAQRRAGCKILLALKGFALWPTFGRISKVLPGVTASSTAEARLGREEFGGEVHACAQAYSEADFDALLELCDHIVVNSPNQLDRFRDRRDAHRERTGKHVDLGLRLNPEHREVAVELYDPCAPRSRLGTTAAALRDRDLSGIDGLHFHTLCELGSDALERTVAAVERKFGDLLSRVRWVNMGGGHHITRPDYDIDRLVRVVTGFRQRHGVDVYLEPGEAIGLRTGVLVASVLDIVTNEIPIAILDTSATAHMPDVLEMPYRPTVLGGFDPGVARHTYRLGGLTCLAGDVVGDWSFDQPLRIGDKLVFDDMIHYTMVKTTTFNGVRLPSICTADPASGEITVHRRFGYEDYRDRLG
jgi:carboxynorspermidine decarboxylase